MTILSSRTTLLTAEALLPRFTELLGDLKYQDRGVFLVSFFFFSQRYLKNPRA